MTIEIFTVCDFAQSLGNSINMMGVFDTINIDRLPFSKSFSVVLRIRYDAGDLEPKEMSYKLFNPKGENILENISSKVDILSKAEDRTICVNSVLTFNNFVFDMEGMYKVEMETEGKIHEIPIYVSVSKKNR